MIDPNAYEQALRRIVSLALEEDLGAAGDITSSAIFDPDQRASARLITRQDCVVSGMAAAAEVCLQVNTELDWLPLVSDGDRVPAAAQLARLEGPVVAILAAERTMLNFLSRLSGVATLTAEYVARVGELPARIAATRKTTPGLRLEEKQAVVDGGGQTHRLGLYEAVMIKDNHIAAAGSIAAAVERVRNRLGADIDIEVEVDTPAQLGEALAAAVRQVLLDNMSPEQVANCVRLCGGGAIIEASGGITLANVREYAEAGADIISVGSLTRGARGIDFSLEIEA